MFYLLSKIGFFFLKPSNLLAALALVGVLLSFTPWQGLSRLLAGVGVAGLLVVGLSPAANWLMQPLEQRFPVPDLPERIAGIIVLGGSIDVTASEGRGTVALTEAAERLTVVPALAARYPQAPVIHTGGAGVFFGSSFTEAEGAQQLFGDFGLAPERILLEDKARNTVENAVFTKRLIETLPKGDGPWILVTSAYHMPRSVGVFRQVGFPSVLPYPVDFRVPEGRGASSFFSGVSSGALRFDTAFREWIGLAVYGLTGKTSALFPAP